MSGPWWAVVGPVLSRIGPVVVRRAGPLLARVNALPREPQAPTDASDAEMDRRERDVPQSQLRADRWMDRAGAARREAEQTNAGTRVGFHLT